VTEDRAPAQEEPLFNLEELHERRILSWSPEPEEFYADESEPSRSEREERAREAYDYAPTDQRVETQPVEPAPTAVAATPAPERVVAPPVETVTRPVEAPAAPPEVVLEPVPEAGREIAPPVAPSPPAADPAAGTAPADGAPKRRGRPRGRPRRQVHFHVDPDEERLLMKAVERYGSQQKGLIAALESLQEADLLRDEIERLRAETARHRRLLDEAEA